MLGIISDVHGNYPALCAVLNELDKLGCNKIISLGDITGYYCMVKECIHEFQERKIVNILGNHDYYIIHNKKCERSYTANICLDYQRNILDESELAWLRKSPLIIQSENMQMVHGGWNNYIDEYLTDFSFLNNKSETTLYISGHTHIQRYIEGEYAMYVNPGAVGQPRDYLSTAAFAVLNNKNEVILHRVPYDIDRIVFEMKKVGFADRIASCLYYGMKIGEDGR